MSNNLLSRQFPVSDGQMVEVHVSDKLDLPVSEAQMRMVGHGPGTALQELAVPNGQLAFTESLANGSVSQNAALSNSQRGHIDPRLGIQGSQQFLTPHQNFWEMGTLFNSPGPPTSSSSVKRKAEVEPVGSLSVSQQSAMPNKRAAQAGTLPHSAGSLQPYVTNKKGLQMQSKLSSPTAQSQIANRKMSRNDSAKSSSQRVQTPKGRTVQIESASKVSSESTEAVRSKMRESLASALELACQSQDKSVNEGKNKTESASHQIPETSRPPESGQDASVANSDKCENIQNTFPPHESSPVDKSRDGQRTAAGAPTSENVGDSEQGFKDFQCGTVLTTEDFSFTDNFFIKDELLQGNGLSWAWELDMASRETSEFVNDVKPEMLHEDIGRDKGKPARPSPQDLAFKIEEELFKLFGGVNKKYKEKGRSLLFNLKDRNNPELRERVVSGEISPEKLCSMTAEELASKELSEWRMAKAEELAQMVVLPDTDINMMRRLVKKTHKGEYQVEVEKDDNIAVEVATGTSSLVLSQPKEKDKRAHPAEDDMKEKENVTVEKSGGENQNLSGRLVIPNDGSDLMQGMIVDEMKDAEFLPPIVSLDEFMESLNSEPPFESLPVDAGQTTPLSDKKNTETGQKSVPSDLPSKDSADTLSNKAMEVQKHMDSDGDGKSKQSPLMQKVTAPESASVVGCLWQGSLQLSISSSVTVLGVFRSGEKTSTQEWPASLEVKGRVRLDAFEKFLQELPMSRSRAVMVLHFLLKDSSSEDERASLSEAVDSYISDERLGFAEPAMGVELYLCPPTHGRILDMLCKRLSKDRAELLNSTDNGLIGVVVWRRPHLSSVVSPNSSSHRKSSLKRQHLASRRQHEKDANANGNITSKGPMAFGQPRPNSQLQDDDDDDDDDDIPPGFGPAAPRDDDDLPEFNFSGNVNQSVNRNPSQNLSHPPRVASSDQLSSLHRPVDQMRELVKKYGQTTTPPSNRGSAVGLGLEPWDDDDEDDDDIPEWRPQALPHNFPQAMQTHGVMRAPVIGQHVVRQVPAPDAMPQHLHANVGPTWQQSARWGHPSRPESSYGSFGSRPSSGHPYGTPSRTGQPTDWRQGAPRSRAF